MEKTKKSNSFWQDMARPLVVLVVICLVAAALLGVVNATTKPVIEANREKTAALTRQAALPDASSFEKLDVSADLADLGVTGLYKGDNGSGYVATASSKGYGGDVTVTVGFDADGKILNVLADVGTETTGVGSKVGAADVLARFKGVSGSADDVNLVSGATYTSKAVRAGVNAAIAAVESVK
ncbi:MAG: FMN-binding protein [Oscillospiraceae bacterium]|nr:FMN-binding protein [Oscillospiraceae bacterium]